MISPVESDEEALTKITSKMKAALNTEANDVPVIGVLTKSAATEIHEPLPCKEVVEPKCLFLLQDAIVVPISLHTPPEKMKEELLKVNGLYLPGGDTNVWVDKNGVKQESDYTKAARALLKAAVELNEQGIHFPVIGICLGFQTMTAVMSSALDIIEFAEGTSNYNAVLNWTSEASHSQLWNCFSEEQRKMLANQKLSFNYHNYMVDIEKFKKEKKLSDFFRIVSTSPSEQGHFEFVSSIEGRQYPFYGFQHHPEWCYHDFYYPKMKVIKSEVTAEIGNAVARLFLGDARRNQNVRLNKEELKKKSLVNAPTNLSQSKGFIYMLNGS